MTPATTKRLLGGVLMLGLACSLFASACGASVKQTDPNTAATEENQAPEAESQPSK